MALKFTVSKDEHSKLSSDELRKLYVAKGDGFVLDVDGVIEESEYDALNTKLAEFRDNNRKLHGDLKKFEGIDVDEYRTLKDAVAKGGGKPEDTQAAIAAAVDKALATVDGRIKAIETERDDARKALRDKDLDEKLWAEGSKSIRENARPHFLAEAKKLFTLDERGELVARNGDQPLYSKQRGRVTEPLSLTEFVTGPDWLQKDFDYLYKQSKGSDAGGSRKPGAGDGVRLIQNTPEDIGRNLEALAAGRATLQ